MSQNPTTSSQTNSPGKQSPSHRKHKPHYRIWWHSTSQLRHEKSAYRNKYNSQEEWNPAPSSRLMADFVQNNRFKFSLIRGMATAKTNQCFIVNFGTTILAKH